MDDFRIVFYIILGIIYLVIRAAGGKKKQPPKSRPANTAPSSGSGGGTGQAPKTFEDLLRQLGQEVESKPAPKPQPQPVAQTQERKWYEDDPNVLEDDTPLENTNYDAVAQERVRKAQDAAARVRRQDEALARQRQEIEAKGRFKEFALEEKKSNHYAELLRNTDGFRDAIVLNAILNRPYDEDNPYGPESRW